jgi:hypothetical protein
MTLDGKAEPSVRHASPVMAHTSMSDGGDR